MPERMWRWFAESLGEPADVMALRNVPVPAPGPGPGQVLFKVVGAALGFPDVLLCRGAYHTKP